MIQLLTLLLVHIYLFLIVTPIKKHLGKYCNLYISFNIEEGTQDTIEYMTPKKHRMAITLYYIS